MTDPLISAIFRNAFRRQSAAILRTKALRKAARAKAVVECLKDARTTKPWNRMGVPLKLYLCESARETLERLKNGE